ADARGRARGGRVRGRDADRDLRARAVAGRVVGLHAQRVGAGGKGRRVEPEAPGRGGQRALERAVDGELDLRHADVVGGARLHLDDAGDGAPARGRGDRDGRRGRVRRRRPGHAHRGGGDVAGDVAGGRG